MKVSKYFSAISLSEDTWLLYAALNDAFVVEIGRASCRERVYWLV